MTRRTRTWQPLAPTVLMACCALVSFSPVVYAQSVSLPGSADPGRSLENSNILPKTDQTKLERAEPKQKAIATAPEGAEELRFVLQDLTLEGLTAYPQDEIRPLYEQYIGREISVATVFEIMAKIQQKYLDDGYALTKVVIPNQNIQGGNVRLAVIEGHVEEIEVASNVKRTPAVEDAVNRIAAMRPLNVKKLERIMLLLNDLPDGSLGVVLAAPKDVSKQGTGAVRLVLQANERQERIGSVGIDNHGSAFSGPWQTNVNLRGTSLLVDHSELELRTLAALPFQEQRLGNVSYTVPLYGISGTKLTLGASKALTEPGSSLSTLDIKGAFESLEASLSYPLIRQRDMTLTIDGGFEWKNSRTKILGEELFDDRLRVAKTGLNFNFTDTLAGYNIVDTHYSQGLDIFGARESGSENLSRQDGKSDFQKFDFFAARLQALPANFEILGVVQGQYAFDPLLSSEEFGFGGSNMGRGYDSSEITGDRGLAGTLELRYRTTAPLFGTTFGIQPYAFYDIGKIWNIDPSAKDKLSAASAGAGVRVDETHGWNLDLNLAVPLTRSVEKEPKYQNDVGGRVLFSISKSF